MRIQRDLPAERAVRECPIMNAIQTKTKEYARELEIGADMTVRGVIEIQLHIIQELPRSRERSKVATRLEEAVMWLNQDLKRLDTAYVRPAEREK
jgi:hypothetical protein